MIKDYLIYSQSLENFIIDLSSYILILIILLILLLAKYMEKKLFIFFSIYCFSPFLFNDFLISSGDMWDQYTNTWHLIHFRESIFNGNYYDTYKDSKYIDLKFLLTSHIYGAVPFLFVKSINSIAFMNKLLLCLTSLYLLNKKYIKKSNMFFLLLFPSTIIYSSLSLKEVMLGLSCIWIFLLLFEKKYFYACLLMLLFFFIRPQFYIFVYLFLIYYFTFLRLIINKTLIIYTHIILAIIVFFLKENLITNLNFFITVYNQEDVGWGAILNRENLVLLEFSFVSFFTNLKIIINKFILNWPLSFKYKILFMLENILLIYFFFKNYLYDYKKNKLLIISSTLFLIISIVILYLIFPHLLPLHRFFYPFLLFSIFLRKFNFNNENHSYNN